MTRESAYEQAKRAWIARQMESAPPLNEAQKSLIRTAFAGVRADQAQPGAA